MPILCKIFGIIFTNEKFSFSLICFEENSYSLLRQKKMLIPSRKNEKNWLHRMALPVHLLAYKCWRLDLFSCGRAVIRDNYDIYLGTPYIYMRINLQ